MTTAWRNRIVGTSLEAPDQLIANPANWRTHPGPQRDALRGSLSEVGWVQQVMVNDRTGYVVDGHARVEEALTKGELVPVLHVDLSPEEEALVLATLDPIGAMATRDDARLQELLSGLVVDDAGLLALLADLAPLKSTVGLTDPDDVPPLGDDSGIKAGDLFALGDHRLMCGDSTSRQDVEKLLGEKRQVDGILTDPPYCSGGFQESGKASGSIGSDAKIKRTIANDTLSTRGYLALLKSVVGAVDAGIAYVFTDWRMWVNLFDVLESSGFGVRNMIVWDKGSPGMGVGWRTQHELIMYASRATVKFDNHKAVGNVVQAQRTGNPDHPTQKPVELLTTLLGVSEMIETLYDPFSGSGTTIIAAEQLGRRCYAMEIDPRYVAVAIKRWEAFTGRRSERLP